MADGTNWALQPTVLADTPPIDASWFTFATRTMNFVQQVWIGYFFAQPATDTDAGEHWTFSPPADSGWLPSSGITIANP